jgi:hypothetical protein
LARNAPAHHAAGFGHANHSHEKGDVIKLDQQPPIENNDLQDLFLKAPGFQITDQHTPGQFNFNYRGWNG